MSPETLKTTPNDILTETDSTVVEGIVPEEERFTLDAVEHDLVTRYQPKFIAKGGEHIVYDIPEHQGVVVKVATEALRGILEWNMTHGLPADSLEEEVKSAVQDFLKREGVYHQQLKQYFGAEHVPGQKEALIKIPVTQDILKVVCREGVIPEINEAWSVITIQKRVEAMNDPHRFSLVTGYAEKEGVRADVYKKITDRLVFEQGTEEKLDKEEFLSVQSPDSLRALLSASETDENVHKLLRELIEKIIIYTEDTGEILDLAGQDNVIVYQKEDKISYSLVDARYPGDNRVMDKTVAILIKLSLGTEIDEHEKNLLLNGLNFVRTVNGLAELLGIDKKIHVVPQSVKVSSVDFLEMLR